MKLSERLKKARKHASLSQKELEAASGVSQQMISRIETGQSKETADIVKLSIACGVRPEWLAEGQGGMTAEDTEPVQLLTDDQRRALEYLDGLSPNQRAEWFRWADEKGQQNREVMEHWEAKRKRKARKD